MIRKKCEWIPELNDSITTKIFNIVDSINSREQVTDTFKLWFYTRVCEMDINFEEYKRLDDKIKSFENES